MMKQVDKAHYQFNRYMSKKRWASLWHQIAEIVSFFPNNVLEIGPGPGILKATIQALGYNIKTLDIDPELNPDFLASATALPFSSSSFDVVCAFQTLEHVPFETAIAALEEMLRVSTKGVVVSLPDAKTCWPASITIPRIGKFDFQIPRPLFKPRRHEFDGQHHWEINKIGYELNVVQERFRSVASEHAMRTFSIHENPYHRFFVFTKAG